MDTTFKYLRSPKNKPLSMEIGHHLTDKFDYCVLTLELWSNDGLNYILSFGISINRLGINEPIRMKWTGNVSYQVVVDTPKPFDSILSKKAHTFLVILVDDILTEIAHNTEIAKAANPEIKQIEFTPYTKQDAISIVDRLGIKQNPSLN